MAQSSTSIEEIAYDEVRQRLTVTFAGGQSIVHIGVPGAIHVAFLAAGHRGSFYTEQIRDHYRRA